jgi:hypothetical protein
MPLFWSLAPKGLETAVRWAAKRRRWNRHQALRVFQAAAVILAFGISVWVFWTRAVGGAPKAPRWGASARQYEMLAMELQRLGFEDAVVAVNNPPGFYLASGMKSIVIPDSGPDTLRDVLERYEADVLVLDVNHPTRLDDLYAAPEQLEWLSLRASLPAGEGEYLHILEVKARDGLD